MYRVGLWLSPGVFRSGKCGLSSAPGCPANASRFLRLQKQYFHRAAWAAAIAGLLCGLTPPAGPAPPGIAGCEPGTAPDPTDKELYMRACAACHGADGKGSPQVLLGFETPPPDFTDCNFATREPDADWIAVAHQGGPVRGFAPEMPAFGDALTEEELQSILAFIRTLCGDDAWPRGELNFPRAIVTEKAYPEDEVVYTLAADAEGGGGHVHEFTYEQRFGARSQLEVVVPVGFGSGIVGSGGVLGDVALGWKRVLAHSLARGSIVSVGGELLLPTGNPSQEADGTDPPGARGLGTGKTIIEPYVSLGQALPSDAFLQLFGGAKVALDGSTAHNRLLLRGVLGKTVIEGRWGRAWTPMVEVLVATSEEGMHLDLLPQAQISLNRRQHVMLNVGARLPTGRSDAPAGLVVYLLWEWFDGGFLEGW